MTGELLPTLQAAKIQESLGEYLTTTFSLADKSAQKALDEFLTHPDTGIFSGPFVRTRTPFEPTTRADAEPALDITPGPHVPYGHQAAAYARLSAKGLAAHERPAPTLVTTGTGSGKTESFLYPILDHVARHRRAGGTGMSALILYPMNALALDQAQRLATMLVKDPQFAGIRAGFYVGESGDAKRGHVTKDGLITDRRVMQEDPPDILLTNYKMLDRLLLRPADQNLWDASALSLQYLVLDEFHTYDGAQGTDVAMLLRRLGARLKRSWPEDHPALTDEHRARPLGRITPVATSATLGDGGDPSALLDFAHTVFGEVLSPDAVITESRYSVDDWIGLTPDLLGTSEDLLDGFPDDELTRVGYASIDSEEALRFITRDRGADGGLIEVTDPQVLLVRTAATLLTSQDRWPVLATRLGDATAAKSPIVTWPADVEAPACSEDASSRARERAWEILPELLRHHPAIRELAQGSRTAVHLADLAASLRTTPDYLGAVIGLLSAVRARAGRAALTVDAHLWIREVSRIDRVAGGNTEFRWSDDGVTDVASDDAAAWDTNDRRAAFPAVFCRNCGRSGWGVLLSPAGHGLENPAKDKDIRRGRVSRNESFRVLLTADGEAEALAASATEALERHPFLRDFHVRQRTLDAPDAVFGPVPPTGELADQLEAGEHLPVLIDLSEEGGTNALNDVCPACGEADSIRFLGAAIATLLSVSVSTLFGDRHLDAEEKKSLVFTDSVQDAAHRAGFIEARSHTFTTRSVLAEAAQETTLATIAEAAIRQAGDDSAARYRLLAPPFTDGRFSEVERWWKKPREENRRGYEVVRRRLAFDAALEFGLQGRVGRTLELTGTAQAEVLLPSSEELDALTQTLFDEGAGQATAVLPSRESRLAWVRGVVEHLRMRGAIHHEWLDAYAAEAGRRYLIWGGRRRSEGMPAFPSGRPAPVFAYSGASPSFDTGFEKTDSPRAWYGRYAAKVLGVDRAHGATLTTNLLAELSEHDSTGPGTVRRTAALDRRAKVYGLDAHRVRLLQEDSPAHLVCTVCRTDFPLGPTARKELEGTACLFVTCSGDLHVRDVPDNFYRHLYTGANLRRVVAREHSSILDAEDRKRTEDGFKSSGGDPSAANVLVATPTLEMGIDIGDLSTVMLSSLPPTVANYVQRVGRAGRLTGNALIIAFVEGRGKQRPLLADPLSVIEGTVRPPATYLDAVEIIERQYVAFLLDSVAGDPALRNLESGEYPRTAAALFGAEPGRSELLNAVIDLNGQRHEELLEEFLGGFTGQIDLADRELRDWATPQGEDEACGLRQTLWAAHQNYRTRREVLTRRKAEIEPEVLRLMELDAMDALADEDKEPLQQARSALRATDRALSRMQADDWVSAMESAQLLPNYTLLDDATELDVVARWRDEVSAEWREDSLTFARGARMALRDFAPGSTFYGRGLQVRVDALELGAGNEDVYTLAFCAQCGYTHDSRGVAGSVDAASGASAAGGDGTPQGGSVPLQCPRCGDDSIADRGQRVDAVQFRRAMAMVNRDEAAINDRSDSRELRMYSLVSVADIDPAHIESRWYTTGLDFGVSHLSRVRITSANLGPMRKARTTMVSGDEMATSLFTVCEACGVLDRSLGQNSRKEHRPWCHLRDSTEEKTVSVALTHLLETQGALIRLPHDMGVGDTLAVPSLMAALQLGLREALGGEPDHIQLLRTQEPLDEGGVASALLLHDIVPGGTGYLADLCRPEKLWEILVAAYRIVRDCTCRGQEIACAQCLLPFEPPGAGGLVSRQSAETSLESLLRAGRSAADSVETTSDMPWTVWDVTDQTPDKPAEESALEGQFRSVVRNRLGHVGYEVQDSAVSTGTALTFTTPQSKNRWKLVPQEPLGFAQPDFVLRCSHPDVPAVAIFTDGYAYHATETINRIGDDAVKRARIRAEHGWPVVSVAHADVSASRLESPGSQGQVSGASGVGTRGGYLTEWLQQGVPGLAQHLRSQTFAGGRRLTWPDGAEEFLTNPLELLLAWVQSIDMAEASKGARGIGAGFAGVGDAGPGGDVKRAVLAVRSFADTVTWMLGTGKPAAGVVAEQVVVDVGDGARSLAQQVADELTYASVLHRAGGAQVADAETRGQGLFVRVGPLGLLFVMAADRTGTADFAAVIDDRSSAVGMHGFHEHWTAWLHISSLLSFSVRTGGVVVTSVQAVEAMRSGAPLVDARGHADTAVAGSGMADIAVGAGDQARSAGSDSTSVDFAAEPSGHLAGLSVEWKRLLSSDELLPEERDFIRELIDVGVETVPEPGYELDSGLPLPLAWPDKRIAVLFDESDEDMEEARDAGWTIVSAGAASVAQILGHGGTATGGGRNEGA